MMHENGVECNPFRTKSEKRPRAVAYFSIAHTTLCDALGTYTSCWRYRGAVGLAPMFNPFFHLGTRQRGHPHDGPDDFQTSFGDCGNSSRC